MGEAAEAGVTQALTVVFLALMAAEATAAVTAAVLFLRSSGWRDTETGRHLAAYMGTLAGLYLVTFVAIFVRNVVMDIVLLASHAAFTAVLWQRAWLVWKAQHSDERREGT
jgi:hypothetical protein